MMGLQRDGTGPPESTQHQPDVEEREPEEPDLVAGATRPLSADDDLFGDEAAPTRTGGRGRGIAIGAIVLGLALAMVWVAMAARNSGGLGQDPFGREAPAFELPLLGAKGDGVADDTAALQSGIAASSNRGKDGGTKILFLPNGTYRVTSNLIVAAAVGPWVYGESRDGVIVRLADGVPTNITAVLPAHPYAR